MTKHKMALHIAIICVALSISMALSVINANAYLVAYEGFDYPQGSSITASNGGYGWSNNWSNAHPFFGDFLVTSGMSYAGLPVSGGAATAQMLFPDPNYGLVPSGNDIRTLVERQDTGVVWVSFLADLKYNYLGCDNLRFGISTAGIQTGTIGTNDGSGYWFFSDGSVSPTSSNAVNTWVPYNSGLHMALLRIDYDEGNTTIWMDPNIESFTGAGGLTANFAPIFDNINIVGRYGGTFDEIRIGTTAQDVFTSVPEPTTMLLLGLGLIGLAGVRRKFQK